MTIAGNLGFSIFSNFGSSGITPIFKNLKVAITGDSLAEQNWGIVSSTATELRTTGAEAWLNSLIAKAYDMPYASNFGYSGQRVATFLSNFPTNCGAYITANNVDHLHVMFPTNDIEDQARTAQDVVDDYESLLDLAVATGVRHIFVNGAQPRGDWGSESAADLTFNVEKLHDVHNGLETLCATYSNVYFIDFFDIMVNSVITEPTSGLAYQPLPGYINDSDGVHWAPLGAYTVGLMKKNKLIELGEYADPAELLPIDNVFNLNPTMAGTGGNASTGASGVFANNTRGQRAVGSTLTIVGSKETKAIFGLEQETQKLVITNGSTSAEEMYYHLEFGEPDVDLTIGEGVQTTCYVEVVQATNINFITLFNRVTIGGITYIARDMNTVSSQEVPDTSITGARQFILRNEFIPVGVTGTTTRCQQLIRVLTIASAESETATINVGRTLMEVKS